MASAFCYNEEKITEEFFIWVESAYQINNTTIEDGTTIVDDEQIDEITVSEIGTYAAPGENIKTKGSSDIEHEYDVTVERIPYKDRITVTIEWETNTVNANKASGSITSESVNSGLDYSFGNWTYSITGELSKPCISYSYDILGFYNDSTYVSKKYAGVL